MAVLEKEILLYADGANISADIAPDLLSLSYTDKENDEADELTITLQDKHGKWAGAWQPEGGLEIEATLYASGASSGVLPCGTFFADSFRYSGNPRTVEISAVSIPLKNPIRKRQKTRTFENVSLKDIAAKIAGENGLELLWDAADIAEKYEKKDQQKKSDLAFLCDLAKEQAISVKVTSGQLVLYDRASYEKKDPVATITLGTSFVLNWNFSSDQSEKYKSVKVSYRDPAQKKKRTAASAKFDAAESSGGNPAVMTYTATNDDAGDAGQEFEVKTRATSLEEAKRIAKAKLRELNQRGVTGSLTLAGDPLLCAGSVIAIAGFGSFDGKYFIETARHELSGGGYTTAVDVRKVQGA